jgi:hypothetical protein
MSYKKEIEFFKNELKDSEEQSGNENVSLYNPVTDFYNKEFNKAVKLPISEDEEKEYEWYAELNNDLKENMLLVEGLSESNLHTSLKSLVNLGDFSSDSYHDIERKIFAFVEIDRLTEEIENFKLEISEKIKTSVQDMESIADLDELGCYMHTIQYQEEIKHFEKEQEEIKNNFPEITKKLDKEITNIKMDLMKRDIKSSERASLERELIEVQSHYDNSLSIQSKVEVSEKFNYEEKIAKRIMKDTLLERFEYNLNGVENNFLSELILSGSVPEELSITKLKELNEVLVSAEDPNKLLNKLYKLSSEAQTETIYSLSNKAVSVSSFLTTKTKEQSDKLEEEIKKPHNYKKNKR